MSDVAAWTLLSLQIAGLATMLTAVLAIPLAYLLAGRRGLWLTIVDTLLTLPLVLPPTVVGYLLVVVLGDLGGVIHRPLLFTEPAAILAATVVILPLLYLPAKAAFAAVDPDLEDAARLSGAGRLRLFWNVSLPLARRGVAAGLVMAFARGLGEFGATVMVLGISETRTTLPIAIYLDYTSGQTSRTPIAIGILVATSLVSVLVYNRIARA